MGNFFLEFNDLWTKGLSFRSQFGATMDYNENKSYSPKYFITPNQKNYFFFLLKNPHFIWVFKKYLNEPNIILIDGLYIKPELDLIRRYCFAYIHTHTLCGTAPSLVEMIISRRPIISYDIPQNRFSLNDQGLFFSSFSELSKIITKSDNFDIFIPDDKLCSRYNWNRIVMQFEET